MINPDKYIRNYFYKTLKGLEVDGREVKLYDFFNHNGGDAYVLMTSADKEESYSTKCGMEWHCMILLDIITIYPNVENVRTRELADDIQEEIIKRTNNIEIENFEVLDFYREYPDDLFLTTKTKQVFRKFIRYNLKLK